MAGAETVVALVVAAASLGQAAATGPTSQDAGRAPLIVVDLIVEDGARQPVTDLKANELEVVQDSERQRLTSFQPRGAPGRYEITYTPLSGKAGAVTVRVLRPGSRARGLEGDFLKPRIVQPPSPLEADLERVLEGRADAADLQCRVAVLRFEPRSDGIHQTIAVEVPSSEVRYTEDQSQKRGRLQILVRIKDADGRVVRRIALDRPLEAASVARVSGPAFERLVWTGNLHLAPGPYEMETLLFEPGSGRATTQRTSLRVVAAADTLQVSSVTLLQPRGFMFLAEPAPDDPFVVTGEPVMPTLDLVVAAGSTAQVRFFVTVYPDPKLAEPPTLTLELLRDQEIVGSVPLKLPPPEPAGDIRYVGLMPTRTFRPAQYVLRIIARQGAVTASEQAAFKVTPAETRVPD